MQKVMAGVSGMKTDSIRRESASSSTSLRVPSTDCSSPTTRGVLIVNSSWSAGAQGPRQVGHAVEIGDGAFVHPAVELAGVEARVPTGFESLLELRQLQLGDIREC